MARPPQKKAFALRLDPAVHAAVERLAATELRSANAQIEMLLREALNRRGIDTAVSERPRRGRPAITDAAGGEGTDRREA